MYINDDNVYKDKEIILSIITSHDLKWINKQCQDERVFFGYTETIVGKLSRFLLCVLTSFGDHNF